MMTGRPWLRGRHYIALAIALELTIEGVPVFYLSKENSAEYRRCARVFIYCVAIQVCSISWMVRRAVILMHEINRTITLADVDVLKDAVKQTAQNWSL